MKYLKTALKVETDHFLDRESVLIIVGALVFGGEEKIPPETKFYEGEGAGALVILQPLGN